VTSYSASTMFLRVVKVREDVYLLLPVGNDRKWKAEVVKNETVVSNCHGLYICSVKPMNGVSVAANGGVDQSAHVFHTCADRAAITFDFRRSNCLVMIICSMIRLV